MVRISPALGETKLVLEGKANWTILLSENLNNGVEKTVRATTLKKLEKCLAVLCACIPVNCGASSAVSRCTGLIEGATDNVCTG